ncbi:hypothetical protein M2132_000983 [Dysgonomonas sp. PH5-45]|nr:MULTISPECIES: hypothetical protein [unclassified Dysgonomonas]MDH6354655.1 hypothetical protein [Dysgonomonas sp. PH5-45]MDH6387552.1 hypothetical protein [Dysgonomonas sp. PH5-37]
MNKIVFKDEDVKLFKDEENNDRKRLVFSREINAMTKNKGNGQSKLARKR